MSTLSEIEKAAARLSQEQKRELLQFLDVLLRTESNVNAIRNLPPAERAADLIKWAAGHEPGPGLPNSAIERDAIYE